MTIFSEVARKVINDIVHATTEESTLADKSTSTKFFAYIGLTRDLTLSQIKRELIVNLLPEINKLVNEALSVDDNNMLQQFKNLITICKSQATKAAVVRRQSSGNTERALDSLVILLESIFNKLAELNLLDIPHDNDPLNKLRYYTTRYYAQKIAASHDLGILGSLVKYQNLKARIELTERQEKLIVATVKKCTEAIQIIDKHAPKIEDSDFNEYQEMRRSHVYLSAYQLQQQNKELCKTYTDKAPISFWDPNDGILGECLECALVELNSLELRPVYSAEPRDLGGPEQQVVVSSVVEESSAEAAAEHVDVPSKSTVKEVKDEKPLSAKAQKAQARKSAQALEHAGAEEAQRPRMERR